MPDYSQIQEMLGLLTLGAPIGLLLFFGFAALFGKTLSEAAISKALRVTLVTGLLASIGVGVMILAARELQLVLEVGDWVITSHYHFKIEFVFDVLSLSYVLLTYILCGTIGAFSTRYLHREPGYNRFFVLFALFLTGMVVTALADTVETLFVGWELVGLASVLLIAFFQERTSPAQNGYRVWIVYRICDAALMLAAVYMHELSGGGDFDKLLGDVPWPWHAPLVAGEHTLLLGFLFIIAAAGKSALVPFSGWLPRAMEGPTPSSAIFYGALSVHLGAFLLLRISPVIESSALLPTVVVVLGALTALYAYIAGSAQTDIKSSLSFAALLQVGIIIVEIGLGFRYLALLHLLGHACLRTLQFVRAPTLLHDYHTLENAIGMHLPQHPGRLQRRLSPPVFAVLYRFGLERGNLDTFLSDTIVLPWKRLFQRLELVERRWMDFLGGGRPS
jgi:NADH-quinone oxidoreductase subunit L